MIKLHRNSGWSTSVTRCKILCYWTKTVDAVAVWCWACYLFLLWILRLSIRTWSILLCNTSIVYMNIWEESRLLCLSTRLHCFTFQRTVSTSDIIFFVDSNSSALAMSLSNLILKSFRFCYWIRLLHQVLNYLNTVRSVKEETAQHRGPSPTFLTDYCCNCW